MRSASRRLLTATAAVLAATLTVISIPSGPAHAESGLRTHLDGVNRYPDLPPGQNLGWIPMVVNESGEDYTDVEVSFDFYEADGELPAVVAIESTQDAIDCDEPDTGRSFVCVIPVLHDEQNFDFELALRDGADRVNHGVTTAEAVIRVDGEELARDTATLDASLPLDGDRITDVKAPKRVWADQVFKAEGATGAKLSFTVHNDTDTPLGDASVFVATGTATGIVPGSGDADCTYDASGHQLGCALADLGAGESRSYRFTLWAKDSDAWKTAKPGRVTIDIVYIHHHHDDRWGHAEAPIELVKPGHDDVLPVTGADLSSLFTLGGVLLLAGAAMLVARRATRSRLGHESLKLAAGAARASFPR